MGSSNSILDRIYELIGYEFSSELIDFVGLGKLSESVSENFSPSDEVFSLIVRQAIQNLKMCKGIEDLCKKYDPDTPIEKPIFIAGTGRTASTFLQSLLGADSENRLLRIADMMDIRNQIAEKSNLIGDSGNIYTLGSNHAVNQLPEETPRNCTGLLELNLSYLELMWFANIPEYWSWSIHQNKDKAYNVHKKSLQLLQGRTSVRWVLKSSLHSLFLESIKAVYPDAKIIQIHRDPVVVYQSRLNIFKNVSSQLKFVDFVRLSEKVLQHTYESVKRIMRFQSEHADVVFNYRYVDFAKSPINFVEDFYEKCGFSISEESHLNMLSYHKEIKSKRKDNEYKKSKDGIPHDVMEVFDDYCCKFDIPQGR